jgi:hypothetical protein
MGCWGLDRAGWIRWGHAEDVIISHIHRDTFTTVRVAGVGNARRGADKNRIATSQNSSVRSKDDEGAGAVERSDIRRILWRVRTAVAAI